MAMATTSTTATTSRAARKLIKQVSDGFTGRERETDPIRRNSYDVDDDKARPWQRVGDGSISQGYAHRNALLETAWDRQKQEWAEHRLSRRAPPSLPEELRLRVLREESSCRMCQAEGLVSASTIVDRIVSKHDGGRDERGNLQGLCTACDAKKNAPLRLIDIKVLRALASMIDFATGKLFPTHAAIAEKAGCSRRSVAYALFRLRLRGLVDWVRRSVKTGTGREFGQQRAQTSSAFTLANRARMARRTLEHYKQLLARALGARARSATAAMPAHAEHEAMPVAPADADLVELYARLEAGAARYDARHASA